MPAQTHCLQSISSIYLHHIVRLCTFIVKITLYPMNVSSIEKYSCSFLEITIYLCLCARETTPTYHVQHQSNQGHDDMTMRGWRPLLYQA